MQCTIKCATVTDGLHKFAPLKKGLLISAAYRGGTGGKCHTRKSEIKRVPRKQCQTTAEMQKSFLGAILERLRAYAQKGEMLPAAQGESLNGYIKQALAEKIKRDTGKDNEL